MSTTSGQSEKEPIKGFGELLDALAKEIKYPGPGEVKLLCDENTPRGCPVMFLHPDDYEVFQHHLREIREASAQAVVDRETEERHDVLCGCGWGRMACPESEIPDRCPVCEMPIGEENHHGT